MFSIICCQHISLSSREESRKKFLFRNPSSQGRFNFGMQELNVMLNMFGNSTCRARAEPCKIPPLRSARRVDGHTTPFGLSHSQILQGGTSVVCTEQVHKLRAGSRDLSNITCQDMKQTIDRHAADELLT